MRGLAFFDLDGTLVSSNVVHQYFWYAKRTSWWRVVRALYRAPSWMKAEKKSRLLFNELFFREYAGLSEAFLREGAAQMTREVLKPALFPGALALLERNHAEGYAPILVTGSLNFAIAPFASELRFLETLSNQLVFRDGVASGELRPPVLAEKAKVDAVLDACQRHHIAPSRCRAYSDSLSDAPMLEAVGEPTAVNPSDQLRKYAEQRNWPILSLK
jgi:HAD superfamily hydrolase (TIGR01490 family)